MDNIKIYVITHKEVNKKMSYPYEYLLVGANKNKAEITLKDNNGITISDKNPDYCELTGLYWIWKNTNEQVCGFVHYRRFFMTQKIIDEKKINKYLGKSDLILAKKYNLSKTIFSIYKESNLYDYYIVLKKVISEKYPNYIETFVKVFNRKFTIPYNMMICKKETLNNYCEWLFDILFEVEERVNSEKIKYVPRAYGYLSENLLIIWTLVNQKKVKYVSVYNTEQSILKQKLQNIVRVLKR